MTYEAIAKDRNGFPIDPVVDHLPTNLSRQERYEFAFRVMAEQGERLGDYLFAAVAQAARAGHGPEDRDLLARWISMSELMEEIHGSPITLTYRACERIEAEKQNRLG